MTELEKVRALAVREFGRRGEDWEALVKRSGVAEIAAINPNVMDDMRHWEGRAKRAEKANRALQSKVTKQRSEIARLTQKLCAAQTEIAMLKRERGET